MAFRAGRGRDRRVSWWFLPAVLVLLAGCGTPEYTYVTNSDDHTYLKIPYSWQQIDAQALDAAYGLDPTMDARRRGVWLAGYDADAAPSATHLLGPHAAAPAVFIGVQDVPPASRGQVSLDVMRDLFRPVSPAARQRAAASPESALTGFGLIADEVLTPGNGLRGVHVVYRYRVDGGPFQIFDQTVYANDDASKVYMFFVRCSTECYQERQQEIEAVVSSFTVRETP